MTPCASSALPAAQREPVDCRRGQGDRRDPGAQLADRHQADLARTRPVLRPHRDRTHRIHYPNDSPGTKLGETLFERHAREAIALRSPPHSAGPRRTGLAVPEQRRSGRAGNTDHKERSRADS